MRPLIKPWLRLKRAHWKYDLGRDARRRALVSKLAPGNTFLDIGGMFSVAGAISFMAEQAGATEVTLMDSTDPSEAFKEEHARRGSSVRFAQGDLHERDSLEEVGEHDVVWCTGVLYHTPHPYLQIEHLRLLTREYLVLGTHVIPEIPGFPGACVFYPLLEERARAGFASTYDPTETRHGISHPMILHPDWAYSNWWWGITPSALRQMLQLAGFEIVEEHMPEPLFVDIVARPTDQTPPTPRLDLARRRGHERAAGRLEDDGRTSAD